MFESVFQIDAPLRLSPTSWSGHAAAHGVHVTASIRGIGSVPDAFFPMQDSVVLIIHPVFTRS